MSAESVNKSAKRSSGTESIQLSSIPSKRASKLSDFDFFQPPHPRAETESEKIEHEEFDFFQPTVTPPALKPKDESYDYSARRLSKTSEPGVGVTIIEVPAVQVVLRPPEFPEGGFWGWMTLFGAVMSQFAGFGYINAYGVIDSFEPYNQTEVKIFEDFYTRDFLSNYSPSVISWIGSAQIFLVFSSGIVVGRLFDKGYYYHMIITGAILGTFSLFMLSLCQRQQFYQVFLCQGIGWGLACGLMYIPSLSVLSHYFHRRRPLAMGVASAGAALGATVHPIILNNVIHGPLGFANGVRVSAAVVSAGMLLFVLCSRTRLPPKKDGKAIPIGDFIRDGPYMVFLLGALLTFCGLFFPAFYIQLNAVTHGDDPTFAFYSLSILNGASILGRVVPGLLAPRLGVFNLNTFFNIGAGIVILSMIAVKNLVGTALFAVFVGFFTGASVSLFAPSLGALSRDVSEIGVRIGLVAAICGILGLFASPIAGALLTGDFIWLHAILFAGITYTTGGCFYAVARFLVARRKGVSIV